MIDILYYLGVAALGGLIGYGVGKLLAEYLDKAKQWFNQLLSNIKRISRAVGILIRQGNRLFKRFVVQHVYGDVEEYYDQEDNGVEIEWDDLSDEAKKALEEDEYIIVARYE